MKWQIFKMLIIIKCYQGYRKIETYIVDRNIKFLEDTLVASITVFKNICTFPNICENIFYSNPHTCAQRCNHTCLLIKCGNFWESSESDKEMLWKSAGSPQQPLSPSLTASEGEHHWLWRRVTPRVERDLSQLRCLTVEKWGLRIPLVVQELDRRSVFDRESGRVWE